MVGGLEVMEGILGVMIGMYQHEIFDQPCLGYRGCMGLGVERYRV